MSYQFYKLLHLFGIMLIFSAFGGLSVVGRLADPKPMRTLFSIMHGVGMLLLLVAGFGLIAKLGGGFPGWMIVKLVLWLFLGGVVVLFKRKADLGKPLVLALPFVGLIAAFLATYKPF